MNYFTIAEMIKSTTAIREKIENTPSEAEIKNLVNLIERVLNPAREKLGKPIIVNSGYRSKELNKRVKGAENSFHLYGRAADITAGDTKTNISLFRILQKLPHRELILENGGVWVHVAI